MQLFEYPDFQQAIVRASEHFRQMGLRDEVIEKDYYVTEALRLISQHAGSTVIFKGGTSLSKGWNLINRFSEDIDLFVDPLAYTPPLAISGVPDELERIAACVEAWAPLTRIKARGNKARTNNRADEYTYVTTSTAVGGIQPRVLLESGIASGREPTELRSIESYLARFLRETGQSMGASDEAAFDFKLLHFRRTFVEKLFTIHARVADYQKNGTPLGPHARHYYDLAQLAVRPEVAAMLQSDEYGQIKSDYDKISQAYFPKKYMPPPGMSFAASDALFPQGDLARRLASEYRTQCNTLCFGTYPAWDEVEARFAALRGHL